MIPFTLSLPAMPAWVSLVITVILVIGATLRLSRFLTADTLGGWLLAPLERWAERKEESRRMAIRQVSQDLANDPNLDDSAVLYLVRMSKAAEGDEPITWQGRLLEGASCPFCWAFWGGLGIIIITLVVAPFAIPSLIWHILLAALTLNYLTGHVVSRLDA